MAIAGGGPPNQVIKVSGVVNVDFSNTLIQLKNFSNQVKQTTDEAKQSFSSLDSTIGSLAGFRVLMGTFKELASSSATLELMKIRLEAVSGSAAEAAESFRFLREEAVNKGFDLSQLAEVSIRLNQVKLDTQKWTPIIENLSLATGASMQSITRGIGQITQQQSRGLQTLSRQINLTREDMEKAGVSFSSSGAPILKGAEDTQRALTSIIIKNNELAGVAEKAGDSLGRKWDETKQQFILTAASIGNTLAPALKDTLDTTKLFLKYLEDLSPAAKHIIGETVELAAGVGGLALAYKLLYSPIMSAYTVTKDLISATKTLTGLKAAGQTAGAVAGAAATGAVAANDAALIANTEATIANTLAMGKGAAANLIPAAATNLMPAAATGGGATLAEEGLILSTGEIGAVVLAALAIGKGILMIQDFFNDKATMKAAQDMSDRVGTGTAAIAAAAPLYGKTAAELQKMGVQYKEIAKDIANLRVVANDETNSAARRAAATEALNKLGVGTEAKATDVDKKLRGLEDASRPKQMSTMEFRQAQEDLVHRNKMGDLSRGEELSGLQALKGELGKGLSGDDYSAKEEMYKLDEKIHDLEKKNLEEDINEIKKKSRELEAMHKLTPTRQLQDLAEERKLVEASTLSYDDKKKKLEEIGVAEAKVQYEIYERHRDTAIKIAEIDKGTYNSKMLQLQYQMQALKNQGYDPVSIAKEEADAKQKIFIEERTARIEADLAIKQKHDEVMESVLNTDRATSEQRKKLGLDVTSELIAEDERKSNLAIDRIHNEARVAAEKEDMAARAAPSERPELKQEHLRLEKEILDSEKAQTAEITKQQQITKQNLELEKQRKDLEDAAGIFEAEKNSLEIKKKSLELLKSEGIDVHKQMLDLTKQTADLEEKSAAATAEANKQGKDALEQTKIDIDLQTKLKDIELDKLKAIHDEDLTKKNMYDREEGFEFPDNPEESTPKPARTIAELEKQTLDAHKKRMKDAEEGKGDKSSYEYWEVTHRDADYKKKQLDILKNPAIVPQIHGTTEAEKLLNANVDHAKFLVDNTKALKDLTDKITGKSPGGKEGEFPPGPFDSWNSKGGPPGDVNKGKGYGTPSFGSESDEEWQGTENVKYLTGLAIDAGKNALTYIKDSTTGFASDMRTGISKIRKAPAWPTDPYISPEQEKMRLAQGRRESEEALTRNIKNSYHPYHWSDPPPEPRKDNTENMRVINRLPLSRKQLEFNMIYDHPENNPLLTAEDLGFNPKATPNFNPKATPNYGPSGNYWTPGHLGEIPKGGQTAGYLEWLKAMGIKDYGKPHHKPGTHGNSDQTSHQATQSLTQGLAEAMKPHYKTIDPHSIKKHESHVTFIPTRNFDISDWGKGGFAQGAGFNPGAWHDYQQHKTAAAKAAIEAWRHGGKTGESPWGWGGDPMRGAAGNPAKGINEFQVPINLPNAALQSNTQNFPGNTLSGLPGNSGGNQLYGSVDVNINVNSPDGGSQKKTSSLNLMGPKATGQSPTAPLQTRGI